MELQKKTNKPTFIVDIDATICNAPKMEDGTFDYHNAIPVNRVIEKINVLYNLGSKIILFTARGMRTFGGDVDEINRHHRPILETWLLKHNVNYNQLIFGKPWWPNNYLIDDRSVTINQLINCDPNNLDEFDNLIRINTFIDDE